MAILGNSLFSIIPDSNNGGNHVLNHSLATIMNGFRTVRPVVVEKFSFYPIQQCAPQHARDVRILCGIGCCEVKGSFIW